MNKNKGIALGFVVCIAVVFLIVASSSFAYAIVSHSAAQVTAGTFGIGNFSFNGFVGIGTVTPTAELDVNGSVYLPFNEVINLRVNDSGDSAGIHFGFTDYSGYARYIKMVQNNLVLSTTQGYNIIFRDDLGERMRIAQGGKVGIGTATPSQKLDVNGNVTVSEKVLSPNQPRARAYLTSTVTNIGNGVFNTTRINFTSETYDNAGNFDTVNGRFNAPVNGTYLIHANVAFDDVVANKVYGAIIAKNGGWFLAQARTYSHSALAIVLNVPVTDMVYLNNTDYIEIYAEQDSGVNTVDIRGGSPYTYVDITLLG